MAAFEFTGTLKSIMDPVTGTSAKGTWYKQDFLVEVPDGQYTTDVCASAWGENMLETLQGISLGRQVKVKANVRSREYNGRWYTEISAWALDDLDASTVPSARTKPAPKPTPAPTPAPVAPKPTPAAPTAPAAPAPKPAADLFGSKEADVDDDMPF